MAEGLLRARGGERFEVYSAGTHPKRLREEAIEVMREAGVDTGAHRSKSVEEFEGRELDYVITVCDNARESCPVFPGRIERIHWSFDDPAAVEGTREERLAVFRRVRDEIDARLREWSDGLS
jgi:arsenate reductase